MQNFGNIDKRGLLKKDLYNRMNYIKSPPQPPSLSQQNTYTTGPGGIDPTAPVFNTDNQKIGGKRKATRKGRKATRKASRKGRKATRKASRKGRKASRKGRK